MGLREFFSNSSLGGEGGVVNAVINSQLLLETSGGVLQFIEMEGLRLVEFVSVGSPNLVCVYVLLSSPRCTIP